MNFKQGLFFAGIVFQVVVFSGTFYFLHEVRHEPISEDADDLVMDKGVQIPFTHYVMGEGKVSCSKYVKVNVRRDGIMETLLVTEGDMVEVGQPLFQVDDGMLKYVFREKVAEYERALAEVKLFESGPSEFDVLAKEKEIDQIQLRLMQEEKERGVYVELFEKNAISQTKKDRQEMLVQITSAEREKILAQYLKLKQGVSEEEKEVKRAQLREKEAGMQSFEKALSDCKVVAPLEGRILKINVHPGEYIRPGEEALMIGAEKPLHLHVLIDEKEVWRITPAKNLRAIAIHRANPNIYFVLNFVTVKPSSNEGNLEILFAFDKGNAPLYLDQTLDVCIEAASPQDTSYLDYQFNRKTM